MSPKDEPPAPFVKKRKTLESVCTPIFDKEMGERMKLMRMRLLIDQAELGERLGVSRSVISRLEKGHLRVPEAPFTLERLMEVFGKTTSFLVYGTNPENFNPKYIASKYWSVINKRMGRKKA
jgi:transcriptional regulator with XRE-family HTH domain